MRGHALRENGHCRLGILRGRLLTCHLGRSTKAEGLGRGHTFLVGPRNPGGWELGDPEVLRRGWGLPHKDTTRRLGHVDTALSTVV